MNETTIFKGQPSQAINFEYYILCAILTPMFGLGLIMFLVRFLQTMFTKYEITNERVTQQSGVLSRKTDETELYRVKDIRLVEPFFLRFFGLSTILLVTSDRISTIIKIEGIESGDNLRKQLRTLIEKRKDDKGVRELELS